MRIKLMIICLTLLCGYAKAQTRGGDSSPPLPKEISAELFDKAVALIKEFEIMTSNMLCKVQDL